MKTTPRLALLLTLSLGLFAGTLHAQGPNVTPPELGDALKLKSGKSLVFQPIQMKASQKLLVTHTAFSKTTVRPNTQYGVMLAVYSTDPGDLGTVLHQEVNWFPSAGAGAGPHVKVFSGFTPSVGQGTSQKGIIAILIGLLLPAGSSDAVPAALPAADSLSAELHDSTVGIGMLLPAVQKVREAAAR